MFGNIFRDKYNMFIFSLLLGVIFVLAECFFKIKSGFSEFLFFVPFVFFALFSSFKMISMITKTPEFLFEKIVSLKIFPLFKFIFLIAAFPGVFKGENILISLYFLTMAFSFWLLTDLAKKYN